MQQESRLVNELRVEALKAALSSLRSQKKPFSSSDVTSTYQAIYTVLQETEKVEHQPMVVFIQGSPNEQETGEPQQEVQG